MAATSPVLLSGIPSMPLTNKSDGMPISLVATRTYFSTPLSLNVTMSLPAIGAPRKLASFKPTNSYMAFLAARLRSDISISIDVFWTELVIKSSTLSSPPMSSLR